MWFTLAVEEDSALGLDGTLDVLQELGTNVDRGLKVVATGEMELDGTVELQRLRPPLGRLAGEDLAVLPQHAEHLAPGSGFGGQRRDRVLHELERRRRGNSPGCRNWWELRLEPGRRVDPDQHVVAQQAQGLTLRIDVGNQALQGL